MESNLYPPTTGEQKYDTLYGDTVFPPEAEAVVRKVLEDFNPRIATWTLPGIGKESRQVSLIELDNRYGANMEMQLNELADQLAAMNIRLRGRIRFCEDSEGYHVLELGEHVYNCSLEKAAITGAADMDLISELVRRGYRVEKAGQARDGEASVVTSFGTLKAVPGEEPDIVPEIRVFLQREDGKQQTLALIGDMSIDSDGDEDALRIGIYADPFSEDFSSRILIHREKLISPDAFWMP